MVRDDHPTILTSIAAARAQLDQAEAAKKTADATAKQAKDNRDAARRLLNDRIITATRERLPQKLIAEHADRTREAIRLVAAAYVDPITIKASGITDDAGALDRWIDEAHRAGLEPKLLDPTSSKQLARVLVYDVAYELVSDGYTVTAHRDMKEN